MAPLRIPRRHTILHCGDTPSLVAGVLSPPLGHRPALAVLEFEVGENRRENIEVVPKARGDATSLAAGVPDPLLGHRPVLAVLGFEVGENMR